MRRFELLQRQVLLEYLLVDRFTWAYIWNYLPSLTCGPREMFSVAARSTFFFGGILVAWRCDGLIEAGVLVINQSIKKFNGHKTWALQAKFEISWRRTPASFLFRLLFFLVIEISSSTALYLITNNISYDLDRRQPTSLQNQQNFSEHVLSTLESGQCLSFARKLSDHLMITI